MNFLKYILSFILYLSLTNTFFVKAYYIKNEDSYHRFILMEIGEKKQIPSPSEDVIILSKKDIIQIQEKKNHINIIGKKKGTLYLKQGLYRNIIKVMEKSEKENWIEWLNIFSENSLFSNLRWDFIENKFHISGSIYRFKTWKKLASISKAKNVPYSLYAHIHPQVQNQAQKYFQSELKPLPIEFQWSFPPKIFSYKKWEINPFSHFGILLKQSKYLRTPLPLIELHFVIINMNNNLSKHLNFNLEYNSSQIIDSPLSLILSSIQHSKEKGKDQVITSKKIITKTGSASKFFLGGEIPIYHFHPERNTTLISFKSYGLSINVTPEIQEKNIIHLNLVTEISEIDPAYSTEKAPATKNYRVNTQLHINEGKTLLLSLFERFQKGQSSSNPGFISGLPLIGSFFSQKRQSKEKSQFYLFITPKILSNKSSIEKGTQ